MDINELFNKITSKSTTVAINISNRSTLEVLEFDKNGLITNYATLAIQYNAFSKELENVNDFEASVRRVFSELNLPLTASVYVSIPTITIEHINIPSNVEDDEEIKLMLMTAAEKNYVFKKYDPEISFYKLPLNDEQAYEATLCYTALRSDEYNKIIDVLKGIGLKIVAVDSCFSTLINGVIATQKVNPMLLQNNSNWNIVNITSNSFYIFAMQGKNLIGVYEEPIAVKSYSQEEVYQVISSSLEGTLGNYPANQIIVVSQSDDIQAEYLSSIVHTDAQVNYIEDSAKNRRQLVEVGLNITQSSKQRISLEAVGTVNWAFNNDGFKFNFLGSTTATEAGGAVIESVTVNLPYFGNVEFTPELIRKITVIWAICLILLAGGTYGGFHSLYTVKEKARVEITEEINQLEVELAKKPVEEGITRELFLANNYNNNKDYKKSFSSVAREIPDMVWVEEFQLSNDNRLYMKGRSYRMDDILNYYDSLKSNGKFKNLKITTLKISNTEISELLLNDNSDMFEETTYEFEFGNQVYSAPVKPTDVVQPTDGQNAQNNNANQNTTNGTNNNANNANNANNNGAAQNTQAPPPPPTAIPKQDN